MKTLIISMSLFLVSTILMGQSDQTLAKVQSIHGKDVFVLNTPLASYEVVGEVKTSLKITSILTAGLVNEDVMDKAEQYVRRANRKFTRKGIEYDAIVYDGGKKVNVIKYTNVTQQGMARIKQIDGVGLFILADPVSSFEVVDNVNGGIKMIPLLTNGFINNSIEKDVRTFSKKAVKPDEKDNTVYISYVTGRRAGVIQFTD